MENNQPSYFYYGDRQLLNQLKNAKLPLQQDWSLLEPYVRFDQWHTNLHQPVTEQEILAGLQQEYDKLPMSIRGLLAFEDFLAKRDTFEADIRRKVMASRSQATGPAAYSQNRLSKAGFIRLFSTATSDYGWRTLADQHQGLCIAISSQASFLRPKAGQPVMLKPVQYGLPHDTQVSPTNPIPGAFSDAEENKARAEWRAVYPVPAMADSALKLAKNDITQIYVSVCASEELLEQVKQLVRLDLRYRKTQVLQVTPDASRWRLTAREISLNEG